MSAQTFGIVLIGLYILLTYGLSWIGLRKVRGLSGFSIGNKDMNAILVGITMAASIASTATFVINPGFVYVHGFAGYLHYGIGGMVGISAALILLCKGFRGKGDQYGALTIPHWIMGRYGSRGLSLFFAVINLLSITFVVLILVGSAILCANLFQIDQKLALTLILLFVFSYVLMGGAYAHAYTNAFQGIMMIVIAVFLFIQGIDHFDQGFFGSLRSVSANYAAPFNPESVLYYDFFSVLGSSFLITFALMMQPHILTKTLYLKGERDVNRFLVTALAVGFIFTFMLFIGFYAKLAGLEIERQDQVVAVYIYEQLSGSLAGQMMLAFISVALLAAGMSTLDGILVALSAMVVNDLYLPFTQSGVREGPSGLALSRYVLVGVGLIAFAIAWNPPQVVGLFAQKGIYGLAAASVVPITIGVLSRRRIPPWVMAVAAGIGLGGHLILNLWAGVTNPSVSASYAMLAAFGVTLTIMFFVSDDASVGGNQ